MLISEDKTYRANPEPCNTCPYRQDTPLGVWSLDEYLKLPLYDQETWAQPPSMFLCHHTNQGEASALLCRGWVDTHGEGLLGLRLYGNDLEPDFALHTSKAPLYKSGQHVLEVNAPHIALPSQEAQVTGRKLLERYERLEGDES